MSSFLGSDNNKKFFATKYKQIIVKRLLIGLCKNHLAGARFAATDTGTFVAILLKGDATNGYSEVVFYF